MTVPYEGRKQLHKADDIKSKLTPDGHIADIPFERVYQWVRTGAWRQKDFNRWLKVLRVIE